MSQAASAVALSVRETVAVTVFGVLSTFTIGTMPTLFGAAVTEGIMPVSAIGIAATVQAAALLVTLTTFNIFARFTRLRLIAGISLAAMAAGLFLSALASEPTLMMVSRAITGAGEGTLMWLVMGGVVRSGRPVQVGAAQVMGAGLLRIAMVAALTVWVVPTFTSHGGWLLVGVAPVLGLFALPFLPDRYPDSEQSKPHGEKKRRGLIPPIGLISLSTVLFIVPGVQLINLYAAPLAEHFGYGAGGTLALNLMSVGNLIGGGLALILGNRLRYTSVFIFGFFAVTTLALMSLYIPNGYVFGIAVGLMSFVHFFRNSFFVAGHLEADPTKRTALFHSPVVMISNIVMQALSSVLVAGVGVTSIVWIAIITGGIGAALIFWMSRLIRRQPH
ncbi:MFS transporter [Leucobacter allii]|uniref:MFS transporter n=1 Tax=Leucobacter allii TaxID=2932247 RepID=UPI001FD299FA|nr:MFS transporter [Leucobacter allii]UOR02380.1 MFS transporter [Leucobacter allii]